ncbi:MAG: MBL fold metallo-hydrolase [Acidobacteriota bacterium]|nr:MBL fold metallo-hydrolase [Acidobacteriota bacterium]
MAGDDHGTTALLYAPHGEPGRFWNPWQPFPGRPLDVLRWQLGRNSYDKSKPPRVPRTANDGAYLRTTALRASVTSVGHSTFAVQDGPDVFLTDPHWSARALLPHRIVPPGLPLGAVPAGAFAILSHNHYDHMDTWTVGHLPESTPWFVPLGLGGWFRRRGRRSVVELDWWQSVRHGRWTVTCLPAQHWSNRLGMGRNATLWCSWLLDSGEHRYYFAGDSGYFPGYGEIGRRFPGIDVALLPIGAYEPRWFMGYQHMDPRQAYRAFLDLGARHMIGMHWGVFDLTDEPVDLAPRLLPLIVREEGGDPDRVHTLAIGERWLLPDAAG